MRKLERWNHIIDECKNNAKVSVATLVDKLKVSQATIRRDLSQMEELNIISRYHGGAKINDEQNSEPPMLFKTTTSLDEKNRVARLASSLIKDNQMIYIDAGSTTFDMIRYISAKNITVATIGIQHIELLASKHIRVIVLGGVLRTSTSAITGIQTLNQLEDLYFDIAFLGVNGVDERAGYTTTNDQEAQVKNKAMRHAKKTYFLSDSTKFNKIYPESFAKLNDGVIITDKIPSSFNIENMEFIIAREDL